MSSPTHPEAVIPLAADFPTISHEKWQDLVAKVLNRGRPEDKLFTGEQAVARLTTTTVDGVTIPPLYTAPDGATHAAPLGYPGVAPFTRGSGTRGSDGSWDVRALHDDPDAEITKAAIRTDLERGATSLWLRVGAGAINPADLADVLAEVLPDLAPVAVSSDDDQAGAAAALLKAWADRGLADRARGNLGFDPIAHAARTGTAADFGPAIEAVKAAIASPADVRALVVDTTTYADAGAGDVDELAFAIATGIEYLRRLADAGVAAEAAFGQLEFRVSATTDQFLTIARLRALRRLWARVGEVLGVPEAARGARQHAVTALRTISRDDPWVNILRGTIATFAAAVGGAEAITVLPFDTAWGLPDDFSRRIARNTQVVLAEESNIGRVLDPAGGSWYVEKLTDDLAAAAWAAVQAIEGKGGMSAALTGGVVTEKIAAVSAERAKRLATRKLSLTGVSAFPKPDEEPLVRRPRPAAAAGGGLTPHRDSEVFEALRDRSAAHAKATGTAPTVALACVGSRRDFGPRETFTSNFLAVAGIATPIAEGATPDELAAKVAATGASVAFVCTSPKKNGEDSPAVIAALRAAGINAVYLAGRATELGDAAEHVDGVIFDGIDVVATLTTILATLGVAEGADA